MAGDRNDPEAPRRREYDYESEEERRESARDEKASKPKSYGEILEEEITQGLEQMERPTRGLFLSGLSAGLDLGFSVLLMAVLVTLLEGVVADAWVSILKGNAYAAGFIFVILGRSELFTEHTALAVFPVLGGRTSVRELARLWGVVYTSNVVGALIFAVLMVSITPPLDAVDPAAFGKIAHPLTDHPWLVILTSAVLAGWLMGLVSWLVSAAKDTVSRIVLVWLVTGTIGLVGLHHCIVGTVEVFAGVLTDPTLHMADYGRFLLWTTIGNAVGGVLMVAVIKYGHAVRRPRVPADVIVPNTRRRKRPGAKNA